MLNVTPETLFPKGWTKEKFLGAIPKGLGVEVKRPFHAVDMFSFFDSFAWEVHKIST